MTSHFKEVKEHVHNLSIEVKKKKRKLLTFCSSEWPTFNVRWHAEGGFDLNMTGKLKQIVFHPQTGYPDQVAYIMVWEYLTEHSLLWIKQFFISSETASGDGSCHTGEGTSWPEGKKMKPKL